MREFMVTWTVQVDAHGPRDAARKARTMQLDPSNLATTYDVWDPDGDVETEIDLADDDG